MKIQKEVLRYELKSGDVVIIQKEDLSKSDIQIVLLRYQDICNNMLEKIHFLKFQLQIKTLNNKKLEDEVKNNVIAYRKI